MMPAVELADRAVILSFGLIRPLKGYELVIDAMPAIVAAHPTACYVIVGATHADDLQQEGEAYRESLEARVRARGMAQHVRFVDRFVGRVELTRWLEAADVFVTPSADLDRTGSGTLAYAMAAGRAIVSTPSAGAEELLADGCGVLVPPGSPELLAAAISDLLGDPERRASIGRRAYERGHATVWSEVGSVYRTLLQRVAAGARPEVAPTPRPAGRTPAARVPGFRG
jgi:glycosyltransferase involved in cell wall biosynthesis